MSGLKPHIFMAFHDAGGAGAAAPLIAELLKIYECTILAHDTAASVLHGIPVERKSFIQHDEAVKILEEKKPQLVFTGTSTSGDTIDRVFIAAAKSLGIPTLIILDYWGNYRARFADTAGHDLACLPDKITVMNEDAAREMIADGVPQERIVIAGSPRFEAITKKGYDRKPHRDKIVHQYNLDNEKPWILFLSQPYVSAYGGEEGSRQKTGYTEKDSALCLINALKERDLQLLVRLHPREDIKNRALFQNSPCVFTQDIGINTLISACDVVTGMSTVALVDAYLMKKPVISIQPGQKNEDMCYLTRCGLIPKCQTPDDVRRHVDNALGGRNFVDFKKGNLIINGAITNNLDLIAAMIAGNRT